MILFVFEGNEREPRLYRTLERLYFPRENDKSIVNQLSIFDSQVVHFVTPESMETILNSFPVFIYEYMK